MERDLSLTLKVVSRIVLLRGTVGLTDSDMVVRTIPAFLWHLKGRMSRRGRLAWDIFARSAFFRIPQMKAKFCRGY